MGKENIKALIFDMDGVLVLTDMYHTAAWRALGVEYGFPVPENVGDLVRGVGRMEALEIAISESRRQFTHEEKLEMAEFKNRRFLRYVDSMTGADVPDGVKGTLTTLREKGYLLAVGSSSKNTVPILRKTGLYDSFDAVADGNMISKSKPDPEIFLKAAGMLRVSPERCAVIEDAKSGILAAKRAGMYAVGMKSAVSSEYRDKSLREFSELTELFVNDLAA